MAPLAALVTTRRIAGPEYTNRFNVYRAAQVIGAAAPGYSSGQAMAALEEVARQELPPEISYDWADLSYQEKKASGAATTVFALSLVFVFFHFWLCSALDRVGRRRGVAAHSGHRRHCWNAVGNRDRDFHYSGQLLPGRKIHDETEQETRPGYHFTDT